MARTMMRKGDPHKRTRSHLFIRGILDPKGRDCDGETEREKERQRLLLSQQLCLESQKKMQKGTSTSKTYTKKIQKMTKKGQKGTKRGQKARWLALPKSHPWETAAARLRG